MKAVFDTLDAEFEKGKTNVNSALEYSEKITKKISSMVHYYSKIVKQISKVAGSQTDIENNIKNIEANERLFVAPGFPGTQTQFFLTYFDVLKKVLLRLDDFSSGLKKNVVDQLAAVNESVANNIKSVLNDHQLAISYRANSLIALKDSYAYTLQQQEKLEKLYKHYESNPSQKNDTELRDACEAFRKQNFLLRQAYQQLYKAHQQYMKSVFSTLGRLKIAEIRRGAQIKKILCNFTPTTTNLITLDGIPKDEEVEHLWTQDIVNFFIKNGIVRTTYIPIKLTPHKFSFNDSRLNIPPALKFQYTKTFPISYGVCTADFKAQDNSKGISVAKEERVYIFDNLTAEWSYIKTKNGEGFVPSDIVMPIGAKYAIVVNTNLGLDDTIKAQAGELLIVHKRKGKYVYENIEGEKGVIPEENVVHIR